jgi:hypothetical protein
MRIAAGLSNEGFSNVLFYVHKSSSLSVCLFLDLIHACVCKYLIYTQAASPRKIISLTKKVLPAAFVLQRLSRVYYHFND